VCGLSIIDLSREAPMLWTLADLSHLPARLRARALSIGDGGQPPVMDDAAASTG
jgi:hypothetical protein